MFYEVRIFNTRGKLKKNTFQRGIKPKVLEKDSRARNRPEPGSDPNWKIIQSEKENYGCSNTDFFAGDGMKSLDK